MSEYQRPTYVWKLDVEYPPTDPWPRGGVPGNAASYEFADEHDGHFWFPRHTRYLTERTANKRAELLRKYGCTVTVVQSNPVSYPQAPTAAAMTKQEAFEGLGITSPTDEQTIRDASTGESP